MDDIRQSHQLLVSRGVTFRQDPHLIARLPDREVWMAFFDDTEGNTLALMSEPRTQGYRGPGPRRRGVMPRLADIGPGDGYWRGILAVVWIGAGTAAAVLGVSRHHWIVLLLGPLAIG